MNTEQYQMPEAAGVCLAPASYSPLMLEFQSGPGEPKRYWHLDFQSTPVPRVTLKGDMPELGEMLRVCCPLHVPAVMVEVLMVVAAEAHGRTAP